LVLGRRKREFALEKGRCSGIVYRDPCVHTSVGREDLLIRTGEMAPRNKPAWKEKGKGSGVSPKELEWQEKQQRSNLENNAAVRKARVPAISFPSPHSLLPLLATLSRTIPPGSVRLSLSLDFLYLFSPPPFPFPFPFPFPLWLRCLLPPGRLPD